jgi:oxygen-independent coproporphyrinogen-3 oxidase
LAGPDPGPCSLYLHVPFCAGLCDYCDFYSIPVAASDPRIDRFVDALLSDAEYTVTAFGLRRLPTLYIGGGTPSLLGPQRIGRLLAGLRSILPEFPGELTLEANPESAGGPFLEACREGGVSRISLGVQTFHEPSRRRLHRLGPASLLPERLRLVRSLFGSSFSADLITGLPGQDRRVLLDDLEKLLAYEPGHVSLYALTVEAGTPLEEALRRGRVRLPDADTADRLWLLGRDTLVQAGYGQYEVSAFALPGQEAAHNIRYWRMENWLGLGPAASGTVIDDQEGRGRRYTVTADLDAYLAAPVEARSPAPSSRGNPHLSVEDLSSLTLMEETCLMAFRYIEGPDLGLFTRRFRRELPECIPGTLSRWRSRGLLRPERAALTPEGLLFLNPFLAECFEELAGKGARTVNRLKKFVR